jgi:hypothetical protein
MYSLKREIITILLIAAITTVFVSPKFTSQMFHIPKDSVFVGMTTYFEDFYYYLDQFYQGKQGNWFTENRFSIERFPATLIYFNHLLLGRIGGLVGWESFQSYNYFGIIFKFLFMLGSYGIIWLIFPKVYKQRICAYLIYLFSTAFPNISIKSGKFILESSQDIFRTQNRILARFGTSPSGMLTNLLFTIIFIYLMIFLIKEKSGNTENHNKNQFSTGFIIECIIIGILYADIVIADAFIGAILLGTFLLLLIYTHWKSLFSIKLLKFKVLLIVLSVIYITVFSKIFFTVNIDPVYKSANAWDINQYLQQVKSIGLVGMIEGFGLQLWLFLYGFLLLIRKEHKSSLELSALFVTGFGLIGYVIPLIYKIQILGFRFLFSGTYIFASCIALIAIEDLARRINRKNSFMTLMIFYLVFNLVGFFRTWVDYIKIPVEPDFHFTYVPKELYEGMIFLRTAEPLDGNVLASPKTSIDLMIPGLSGRYTYTGHFLTSYEAQMKDNNANDFFFKWTDRPGTHAFLKNNNIHFIVVTKYSETLGAFRTYYPFLKVVFENPTVTIFKYDSETDI